MGKRLIAVLVAVAVLAFACFGCANSSASRGADETEPAAPVTPLASVAHNPLPDGASAYVLGTEARDIPELERPARGASVTEPVFGTPILRLTDIDAGDYAGPGIENEYSRTDPENADGTLAVLRGNGGDWYVCALEGGFELTSLAEPFADCVQEPEPRWDSEDPTGLYYVCGTQLRRVDLATGDVETLYDFADEVPDAYAIGTRTEGEPSLTRRYWAFMVWDEDFATRAVVVYDLAGNRVIGRLDASDLAEEIDWVGMSPTGERVLIGYETLPYMLSCSRGLDARLRLPDGSNAHGDFARTADGRDVWVYQNTATDFIAMADLDSGNETPLLEIPFGTNLDIGLHFSGNCVDTPGWVLVSTYGARGAAPTHSWMDTQLFMLELADSPRIWRLAHTRCYTAEGADDDPEYFAEAFAAINADGTHVYFGSNWGELASEYTDAYLLLLPEGWTQKLQAEEGSK